jgi:hypothetical protein
MLAKDRARRRFCGGLAQPDAGCRLDQREERAAAEGSADEAPMRSTGEAQAAGSCLCRDRGAGGLLPSLTRGRAAGRSRAMPGRPTVAFDPTALCSQQQLFAPAGDRGASGHTTRLSGLRGALRGCSGSAGAAAKPGPSVSSRQARRGLRSVMHTCTVQSARFLLDGGSNERIHHTGCRRVLRDR